MDQPRDAISSHRTHGVDVIPDQDADEFLNRITTCYHLISERPLKQRQATDMPRRCPYCPVAGGVLHRHSRWAHQLLVDDTTESLQKRWRTIAWRTNPMNFDFAVYGATPAGIMAAVSAARLGMGSVIIEPSKYVGGLMTSGLNATDSVDTDVIRGISREFFDRVSRYYGTEYLAIRVESKVAEKIFLQFIEEEGVTLLRDSEIVSVARDGSSIISAILRDGQRIDAKWWVDATYEGDLLEKGGLSYAVGRESQSAYGEEWAGVQKAKSFLPWGTSVKISPKKDGKYLPYVSPYNPAPIGSADKKVQSYCIRVTLTNNIRNRVPLTAPDDFDFSQFDIFRKLSQSMARAAVRSTWYPKLGTTMKSGYFNLAEIPNGKFDMNSGPMAPTNNPSLTTGWLEASQKKRAAMTEEFVRYTKALIYFIQNDPAVPFAIRSFLSDFGLPADEYLDTGNFPPQVYVREGRRLIGEKVFTQNDIMSGGVEAEQAVSQSRYHLDCKPVSWTANRDGSSIVREGMFFSNAAYKYNIPSWIILPKRDEAQNFFSVCGVSASHVAFGSIRMEPTWMELGSIAALVAHLSDELSLTPHDVPAIAIKLARETKLRKTSGSLRLTSHQKETASQGA